MSKKKGTISGNYENEFVIIGIACHLNDYRLVHFLNKTLSFNFTRYDDLLIYQKNSEIPLGFPFYYFDDNESYTSFYFISNRNSDGIIINEWKQIDFLLIAFGSTNNIDLESIVKQIRKIPNVLLVSKMPFTKKNEFDILMTDIELHINEIIKKEKADENEAKKKLKISTITSKQ